MKRILLIIVFIFATNLVVAESIDAQLEHIYSIRLNQAEEARNLLQQLEPELGRFNSEQKAKFYSLRAHSAAMAADYNDAIKLSDQAITLAKDYDVKAKAMSLKSKALFISGKFQDSFKTTYEILDNFTKIDSRAIKKDVLMNAIADHLAAGILDQAKLLSLQSLALARSHRDDGIYCEAYYQLSGIEMEYTDYDQVKHQIDIAKPLCAKVNNQLYLLGLEERLASISLVQKSLAQAERQYRDLYKKSEAFGWEIMHAIVQTKLSEIYLQQARYQDAAKYGLAAYRYSKEKNDIHHLKQSSLVLAKLYKELDDVDKANFYNKEYIDAAVKMSGELERRRLGYYQAMNYREKQKELATKNSFVKSEQ
ncbi:MAG: hypothetical protein HWE16_09360 [Gammaproteobacteria bacterium]|nr:hypothetical protein [Gammaproteobacteria bacterium]